MTTWGPDINLILSAGTDLSAFGVQGWALSRADALEAIERLRELGVPIAGGDAFERTGDELELAYANWSCEIFPGESIPDYVARSAEAARQFIADYKGRASWFAIVPRTAKTLPALER